MSLTPSINYINWKTFSVANIVGFTNTIKIINQKAYDQVANIKEKRTYDNTLKPLIVADNVLNVMVSICCEAYNFHPDKAIIEASNVAKKEINDFLVECAMRQDVYRAIKEYSQDNKEELTEEATKHLADTLLTYKRLGMDLSDEKQVELKAIINQINNLNLEFEGNLNACTDSVLFTKEELAGIPERWFTEDKIIDGKYGAQLKMPDVLMVLDYVHLDSSRKEFQTRYHSKCKDTNLPILSQILKLRHQMAQLLGYQTYADYKIEINMAKTPKNVFDFSNDINGKFDELYDRTRVALREVKAKHTGNPDAVLEPWDTNYYIRLDTEQRLNIDYLKVEEYFPIHHVTKTILEIYQELLSLTFTKIETDNIWHSDVELYSVHEGDILVGHFYLDLYPRDDKYSHFCCMPYGTRCKLPDGTTQLACATLLCNFAETCQLESVVTYFHEFGHVMHHLLSNSTIADMSGFGVETDFVEAMSQMLELWCNEPTILKRLSCHKDTKEQLSDELIQKIIAGTKINQSLSLKRQIMAGMLDMRLHTDRYNESLDETYSLVHKEILKYGPIEGTNFCGLFGHLASEYGASYYGYMFSEVMAADMFTKFKEVGILNKEMGNHYKDTILRMGCIRSGKELVNAFLGREPRLEPFLEKYTE